MPVSEHTQEELRAAADHLNQIGWGEAWNMLHPIAKESRIREVMDGSGILIPAHKLLSDMCDLTRCRELLKRTRMLVLDFRCEGSASPKEVDEVLAAIEEEVL